MVALEHRDPRLIDTTLTTDANGGTVRDVFAALTSGEEFVNSIRLLPNSHGSARWFRESS